MKDNENSIELLNVEAYFDEELNNWFLKIIYRYEDEKGVYLVTFPKVSIGIPINNIAVARMTHDLDEESVNVMFFKLLDEHPILPDERGNIYYQELIREKVHEITIEEIEKKLGYKVKIVSKDEGLSTATKKNKK